MAPFLVLGLSLVGIERVKKYILVFGYTKLHSFFIENISKRFVEEGYIPVDFYQRPGEGRLFSKVRQVFLFFWFRMLLALRKDVSILLPHPEQLLSNFFFYSRSVSKIYLYEDGLMNYLYVELPELVAKRVERKRRLSRCLFYKFESVKGYLSGCEQRSIAGTFVRVPDMLFMPEKHGRIFKVECALASDKIPNSDVAIFVDQDVESIYAKDVASGARKEVYDLMKGFKKVYLKPHHNYWTQEQRFLNLPDNFELLPEVFQRLTAEEAVVAIGAGSVWGFFSSALINVATMLPEVECYSYTPKSHIVRTVFGEIPMSELMSRFGVRVL